MCSDILLEFKNFINLKNIFENWSIDVMRFKKKVPVNVRYLQSIGSMQNLEEMMAIMILIINFELYMGSVLISMNYTFWKTKFEESLDFSNKIDHQFCFHYITKIHEYC